ncbi:MAG: long-chain-fatty-acid--CoA ligase [Actinomycetota bacterium]
MNVSQLLRDAAARLPDKLALIEAPGSVSLTFADLDREVEKLAAALAARGLKAGDRVAIVFPNVRHFPIAYLATLRAGGVAVPINLMLTAPEMGRIMADADVSFAVVDPGFLEAAEAGARSGGVDIELISSAVWADLPDPPGASEITTGDDDLAVLSYTSGTTGEPKGAMLSHANLLANLDQQMAIPRDTVHEGDVLFLTLPMFHIFGLNVPLGLLLLNGATGLIVERFEPVDALRLIERHKVTVLFGAPPMYVAWVNTPGADQYDLSSVRLAVSGAAALSEEVLQRFRDLFGIEIYEGYGLTETAPTLTTNRMAERPRPGSVGLPLPGVELRVVDDKGDDVEFGDEGEIVVRGPNVFQGYWRKHDATERAFLNGWFRTGDLAVRDEDGFLYLVDRKRDLIIVSGFNVFPSEVEAALVANPKVAEAAVVGEKHPYTGETVKAYVVLDQGEQTTEEELIGDVQTRIARFKCPTSIDIVDSLPHLLTGKVLRRALRT